MEYVPGEVTSLLSKSAITKMIYYDRDGLYFFSDADYVVDPTGYTWWMVPHTIREPDRIEEEDA